MNEKFEFEKINVEYLVAVIFLGAALLAGIVYGEKELAINIASGIIGYIGGRGMGYASARTSSTRPPAAPPPKAVPPKDCPIYEDVKGGRE